jgi:hypothetical protein
LPEQTSGRLARLGGVDQRVAQRWISGDADVPQDVVAMLQAQRAILDELKAGKDLHLLIDSWKQYGLDDEVIGALISVAYEHILKRRIR